MQQCSIKISNLNANYQDYKEVDSVVEEILFLKYGEEFIFDFDVWWRQAMIDYRVRTRSLYSKNWDSLSKSSIIIWETPNQIIPFVDYFFNHEMFLKFKNALEEKDWVFDKTIIEL
jgi:hypothetical protein